MRGGQGSLDDGSRELRSLLFVILASAAELLDSDITAAQRERVKRILGHGKRVLEIVNRRAGRVSQVKRPRVLVVEDDPTNQRLVALLLKKRGCDVDLASDGLGALDAIAATAYGLVLMDGQMPRLDGYAAATEIRKTEGGRRRVPIVAMTADHDADARARCLAAGMDDYLAKPVTGADLDRVLAAYAKKGSEARRLLLGKIRPRASAPPPPLSAGGNRARARSVAPPRRATVRPPVAPEPAAPSSGPIDQAAFARLGALQREGEPDIVAEIVELFLVESARRRAELIAAIGAGDLRKVARSAHTLKGSAANLGATGLVELCAAVEALAKTGEPFESAPHLVAIGAELERVNEALRARVGRRA